MIRVRFVHAARAELLEALRVVGVRSAVAGTALKKWEHGAKPEPCVEEAKGKEYGLASDCRCLGCVERQCFQFFDVALAQTFNAASS